MLNNRDGKLNFNTYITRYMYSRYKRKNYTYKYKILFISIVKFRMLRYVIVHCKIVFL